MPIMSINHRTGAFQLIFNKDFSLFHVNVLHKITVAKQRTTVELNAFSRLKKIFLVNMNQPASLTQTPPH